jgi:hypothetical protein
MIKIGPAGMNQPVKLILGSFNNFRVAVAGVADSDSRSKIKEGISIGIIYPHTFSLVDNQRILPWQ